MTKSLLRSKSTIFCIQNISFYLLFKDTFMKDIRISFLGASVRTFPPNFLHTDYMKFLLNQ